MFDQHVNRAMGQAQLAVKGPESIRVVRLQLQETGTYNQQWLRPFDMTIDNQTSDMLLDRLSRKSSVLTMPATEVADICHNILTPSVNVLGAAGISNGWQERRLRFTMVVQVGLNVGGGYLLTLTGYTDYAGVIQHSGSLDPNMVFVVNNAITSQLTSVPTQFGQQVGLRTLDNNHIHIADGIQPGSQALLRPVDLFESMSTSEIMNTESWKASGIIDPRSTIDSVRPLMSRRANSLPSNYVANVIGAGLRASSMSENWGSNEQFYTEATSNVAEANVFANPFLRAIGQVRGDRTAQARFTVRDLMQVDQNVDSVTDYIPISLGERQPHYAGQTADWNGRDLQTVSATVVGQSVPAIMTSLSLIKLAFSSTNNVIGGNIVTVVTAGASAAGNDLDLSRYYDMFAVRFEAEVFRSITHNNQLSCTVEAKFDLGGESWVQIQIGDQSKYMFVVPSFADSLFAPTIGTPAHLNNMSQDFDNLIASIKNHIKPGQVPTAELGNFDVSGAGFAPTTTLSW